MQKADGEDDEGREFERIGNVNLKIAFVCILAVGITAYFGSLFTAPSIASGWYEIIKPDIAPPNFVFPIVWTVLYLMI
ncbi:tryptophan-rich sensory protein, partial [Candidatus Micrarchaeota archaeon]|nr:tryptophan-rich sensory protein [Candidatus Micrarchaeota archaeon]